IMTQRGYTRSEVNSCLSDGASAKRLIEASQASWEKSGITGTPSFAINGTVLADTHSWKILQPQLDARLK
ncbi:MAG: DsbA family protein, partial [Sphingomonadaceae bacterium]